MSSPSETESAMHSKQVTRQAFNILDVLRTPYRINIIQPVYFMLKKVSDLDGIRKLEVQDIMELVAKAQMLGLHDAKFTAQQSN